VFTDNKGNTYYSYSDPKIYPDSGQVIDSTVLAILLAEQSRKYYGLIAQDVERIVPEVVRTMPDGTKGLAYQSIIPLLIEAVKTQQSEIEELQIILNEYIKEYEEMKAIQSGNGIYEKSPSSSISNSFLYQNIPNPFSQSTIIRYHIAEIYQKSEIYIFTIQGELVKTYLLLDPNKSEIVIKGEELKPGMYLYTLLVDGREIDTKRMILTD
jgi:hypothetical protein